MNAISNRTEFPQIVVVVAVTKNACANLELVKRTEFREARLTADR